MARDNYVDTQFTPRFQEGPVSDKDLVDFCVTCYPRGLVRLMASLLGMQ